MAVSNSAPLVESFFHKDTCTFTHVVYDRDGGECAIVDPVLDYDAAAARTSTVSADAVVAFVRRHDLHAAWAVVIDQHAKRQLRGGECEEVDGGKQAELARVQVELDD